VGKIKRLNSIVGVPILYRIGGFLKTNFDPSGTCAGTLAGKNPRSPLGDLTIWKACAVMYVNPQNIEQNQKNRTRDEF